MLSSRFALGAALGVGLFLQPSLFDSICQAQPDTGAAEAPAAADTGAGSSVSGGAVPVPAVAYSTLFKETAPVPGVNSIYLPADQYAAEGQSDSLTARFQVAGWGYNAGIDSLLGRGFSPDDANLKLGPLYFRLDRLTGTVLFSDNINQRHRDRESGWLAITELDVTLMAQISDELSFAFQGAFYYLPLDNRAGLSSILPMPGVLAGYGLLPQLHGQVAYTTMLGEDWPVTLADDVQFGVARFSDSPNWHISDVKVSGFDSTEREGIYSVGARSREARNGDSYHRAEDQDFSVLSNVVSLSTQKDFGDWVFNGRIHRDDFWYFPSDLGLPSSREGLEAQIVSQRENLRFKPFAAYTLTHTDGRDGIDQTILVGVTGPITDQLFLRADVGYFWTTVRDSNSSLIGGITLDHIAGPYTTESLFVGRTISDFHDQINDTAAYRLSQILGPGLRADFLATYGKSTGNQEGLETYTETRLGAELRYDPSPKTELRLGSYYSHIDGEERNEDIFTEEAQFTYRFTDSLSTSTFYRFRQDAASPARESYHENLVVFSISKTF